VSGLFAIVGAPSSTEEGAAARMLEASRPRGGDRSRIWTADDCLIGACRSDWEMGPDFADGELVLERASVVVAADASLYYREDLRRALRARGVRADGESASQLIAAAYQAWGAGLVDALEGDYAFVLWDRQRRQLVAACDFTGSRPLHFAQVGDRLVLASALTAVTAHPAVSRDYNRLALAECLIGASSTRPEETVYQAVQRLPAGARLVWRPGAAPDIQRYWEPPVFDRGEGPSATEAAEQLRAVLRAAVRERLATAGPTAVWTSGGYDSPAILALGQTAAKQAGHGPVVPVSMSYPEGDPGREDELITAVAARLNTRVRWTQVGDVPGFQEAAEWARLRDEPFAHPYEQWNRTLARGARLVDARVVLGGNGGDQFFSVSPVFLADLARSGHWLTLMREASAIGLGVRRFRDLFHWTFQPHLPGSALELARRMSGKALRPHLQSQIPGWLELDRATIEALRERQWTYALRRPGESFGSAETSWYLTTSFGQRICATVARVGLDEGVETRSPMYDRRVIEFMARRPREDRFARGETKRLLRRAMAGLLPESHLAPRRGRTGLPHRYLQRARREAMPGWMAAVGHETRLGALGLVNVAALRQAVERYLATPKWEGTLGGELFNVFSTEFWLREHGVPQLTPQAKVA
jgi:asparagine synthase (glutamine-hydrolysing)